MIYCDTVDILMLLMSLIVNKFEQMRDTAREFQTDLQRGEAEEEDFGDYIFGQHGNRDRYDDQRNQMKKQENQFKAEIKRDVYAKLDEERRNSNIRKI